MKRTLTIARHVSRAKAERLVAAGRVLACSTALLAAAIGFAMHRAGVHELVITVLWWTLAVLVFWQTHRRPHARATALVLVIDLAFIAILLISTEGVASVYFPMIVLPPFAANLLYGKRAILWAAAGSLTIYVGTLLATHTTNDPRLMIMRFGAVVLIAVTVVLRAEYEERIHHELEQLATWPRTTTADRETAMREILGHAAATLRATRAAAVWTESDGTAYLARLEGEEFEVEEEHFDAVVAPELGRASSFLAPGLRTIDGRMEEWSGPFLSAALGARLHSDSIIGARFVAQTVAGWLFALDRHNANADDVMLAEIVARLVSAGLDQINLASMMRDSAAAAERIRLSRDLHDGLLQSLSGLALHAQGARRVMESDPKAAQERLQLVVEQLAEGQRALRDFVDELRPELAVRRQSVRARLEQIAGRIAAEWSVAVEIHASEGIDALPAPLSLHLASVVAEAIANAAKHAAASRIRAIVEVDGAGVRVDIEDDGRGFPFRGRYDLTRLLAEQRGPWSLKERVIALGGELVIDSSSHGSRVEVFLPVAS